MTLLDIEKGATNSEMLVTEFTDCFWHWCLYPKNKAKINKLARELNIYPKPANVYQAVLERLFDGIAITPYSYSN
jgi:hypothetical protein